MATGFPTGQMPLKSRLDEIRQAVSDGATEIDIVINRHYALTGQWEGKFCFVSFVTYTHMLVIISDVPDNRL